MSQATKEKMSNVLEKLNEYEIGTYLIIGIKNLFDFENTSIKNKTGIEREYLLHIEKIYNDLVDIVTEFEDETPSFHRTQHHKYLIRN